MYGMNNPVQVFLPKDLEKFPSLLEGKLLRGYSSHTFFFPPKDLEKNFPPFLFTPVQIFPPKDLEKISSYPLYPLKDLEYFSARVHWMLLQTLR